jgi:hypothetical protein
MRTKALEDESSGLEFEYFLARELRMLRGEMIERMPNAEFVFWTRFYARKAQQEEIERLASG